MRSMLRSSLGGEGGGCGDRVYTGDGFMYGLTVSTDAISCL